MSNHSKVEFYLCVTEKISKRAFPNLTLELKLPNGKISEFKTNERGVIHLKEPKVTVGKVDILQITDKTAQPWISYNKFIFIQKSLAMNTSNTLEILNKRKLIDSIIGKRSIVRRSSWGKKTPNYAAMAPDWNYNTIVIHHSGN